MKCASISSLFLALLALGPHTQAVSGAAQNAPQTGGETVASTPAPFEVAKELASSGRLAEALTQLDQLALQIPEPAGVERLRGIIFYEKEEFSKATAAFAHAAAQDPNDRESIEMQGLSLFRLGRSNEALPLLEKARAAVNQVNIDPQ